MINVCNCQLVVNYFLSCSTTHNVMGQKQLNTSSIASMIKIKNIHEYGLAFFFQIYFSIEYKLKLN